MRPNPLARPSLTIVMVAGLVAFSSLAGSLPWLAGLVLGGAAAAAAALGQRLGQRAGLAPAYVPVRRRPPREDDTPPTN